MIRDLGPFIPRRAARLDPAILAMLLNGLHDCHQGRVFVLQVGAGTGVTTPPLLPRFRNDGWSGLLIEPLAQNFAQLEALHAESDRVAVLNLGISDVSANLMLHALAAEADARYRRGPRGRASVMRDRIAPAALAEDEVTSLEAPFLRMDTVLAELGIDSAQLVAINAGGHEAEVLASFSLAALDPSLVLVHSTLGAPGDESCVATLAAAGFLSFRVAGWLVGLAPGRLVVPLEELLTFFQRGLGARQEDEE